MYLMKNSARYALLGLLVLLVAGSGLFAITYKKSEPINSEKAVEKADPILTEETPKIDSPVSAIYGSDKNFLSKYLRDGGDPNLKKDGVPLLVYCWQPDACGHTCGSMLIVAGAKVDVTTNNGDTALMEAAMWTDTTGIRMLLHYGANPNAVNKGGETPLHRMGFSGAVTLEAVKALVEAKANVNAKTKEGETVLKHFQSEPKIVEYLRQNGAK